MSILEIKGLTQHYRKDQNVFQNFHLTLPEGKIIGLLGQNGCGKTTLMKAIAGVLPFEGGEIFIDGKPLGAETKQIVSYLPDRSYFPDFMKVEEMIGFFADFYRDFDVARAEKLLADLQIDKKSRLKTLSKGTKEKVSLILVMARRAKLYLLDEPIAGVDPAAREYILSTIVSNYDPKASILITTHLISDIEQVLDEYLFLAPYRGIVQAGSVEEVREKQGKTLDQLFREVFQCSGNY